MLSTAQLERALTAEDKFFKLSNSEDVRDVFRFFINEKYNKKLRKALKFQVGKIGIMDDLKPPYTIQDSSKLFRSNLFLTAWCGDQDISFKLTWPILTGEIEALTEHVAAWATLLLEAKDDGHIILR